MDQNEANQISLIKKMKSKTIDFNMLDCVNTLDYKLLYNRLNSSLKDKTPVYYAISKNGKVRAFNSLFQVITYDYKKDITNLTLTARRANSHVRDYNNDLKSIRYAIATRLGLKVYKNGNMPKKSEEKLNEYLSF